MQQPLQLDHRVFLDLVRHKLPSTYIELVPNVLLHYMSDSELCHLHLLGNDSHQLAGVIDDVLGLLDVLSAVFMTSDCLDSFFC